MLSKRREFLASRLARIMLPLRPPTFTRTLSMKRPVTSETQRVLFLQFLQAFNPINRNGKPSRYRSFALTSTMTATQWHLYVLNGRHSKPVFRECKTPPTTSLSSRLELHVIETVQLPRLVAFMAVVPRPAATHLCHRPSYSRDRPTRIRPGLQCRRRTPQRLRHEWRLSRC